MLAEWRGDDLDVARLLRSCMPPVWRLNALVGDTLPNTLSAYGWHVNLVPTKLRMILALKSGKLSHQIYNLRLLDRI